MFSIVVNEYISLRLLMKKDAEALFQLVEQSRNDLRKWMPWVDHMKNKEDYVQIIPQWLAEFASETSLHMGIFVEGQIAGVAGFHSFDHVNQKTSIGYWLGKKYRGKGIMTKVVRKMVEIAFRELEMNRVEIRCAVENKKSRLIPERLGFYQEGILRLAEKIGDRYVDHVVYAILKQDYSI